MIYEAKKEEILKFRVDPPLFCPFYNIWGEYAKESGGYPVISYLPDIFPETVWKEVRERILTLYDASGARREQTC